MTDFSTLGKRIKYGLTMSGKSQAQLSKYTGIKSATVSQWCSDKVKTLKSDNALMVSKFLGVNYNWLVTGKGSPDAENVTALPDDVAPNDDYVQIKEFSVKCGAGPSGIPTYEEAHDSVPATYRESFFRNLGIKPEDCMRFRVHGDSMEPTLFDGDRILVHLTDNQGIENNHVYAINIGSEVRVKRLIKKINGDLIIHSDNPVYPDECLRADDESVYFSIIGRVIEKTGHGGL